MNGFLIGAAVGPSPGHKQSSLNPRIRECGERVSPLIWKEYNPLLSWDLAGQCIQVSHSPEWVLCVLYVGYRSFLRGRLYVDLWKQKDES